MSKTSSAATDLNALRAQYADKLPGNIRHILSLWDNLLYVKWNEKAFEVFRRLVHNLAGTSSTHGFTKIGAMALHLDQQLEKLQNSGHPPSVRERAQVTGRLQRLSEMLKSSRNLEILDMDANHTVFPTSGVQSSTRVLMLEDDADHAALVKLYLEQRGCEVEIAEEPQSLQTAIDQQTPDILLLDVMLPGQSTGGIEALTTLRKSSDLDIPVLFMSARGDLETRLAAVRAGGSGYFIKPMDLSALSQKIESLKDASHTRYRVLIVDDDDDLAAFHAAVLKKSGIKTRTVTNPMQLLHVLKEFRPDLVLLDLYMPKCHGDELAQVIRQDPTTSDLPILYLSSENNAERQNAALGQGGDAFLVKPVADIELVNAITNRVKRARWLKQRLHYLDQQDSETGLINQRSLLSQLETTVNELAGTEVGAALLFVEVDRFRTMRDQGGVSEAEQVLAQMAGVIRSEMGPTEQVARFGEASFVVLMPGVSTATATAVSDRLRETIARQAFRVGGRLNSVTVSIGVAPLSESYQYADEWLSGAAVACDIARSSGYDKSYLHQPMTESQAEHDENDRCLELLRKTLQSDSLRCVYQPIASLQDSSIEIYDLMVRLSDDDGREVLPARFLSVAETHGLAASIDRWVTRHAVRTLMERYSEGIKTEFFVKMSAATLADQGFSGWFKEQLDRSGLPATALVFEFAERIIAAQLDNAHRLFEELRGFGCGIALEHFGTRLDSLALLDHLNVNYVKIDGSFSQDLANNQANQNSIREILEPAIDKDIMVIASCVEDAASLSALWRSGVQLIQGNFLQEPGNMMNFTFRDEEV